MTDSSIVTNTSAGKNDGRFASARWRRHTCVLFLCFALASAADLSGAITNVSVAGVTNTQAILTWTAPDAQPCTVQISESANLTPLVHDVDSAIFPGSNLD